jgi:hypothetical protein
VPAWAAVTPGTVVLIGTSTEPNYTTAPEAGSGTGYTSASNSMQYGPTNDADGNRWGLSYAGVLNTSNPLGSPFNFSATLKRSHVFGIHAVIGGGATKTGDDQLYGMDRAWFAMLAQQTSAGVL